MNTIKNFTSTALLRLFLGLVFVSAGLYKIFNWQQSLIEISNLNLSFPYIISVIVVILEIIGGLFLIFNIQTKKVLLVFAGFLSLALLWTIIISWEGLLSNAGILFAFRADPTDFFLHFTYLIILIYLLSELKRSN